MAWHFVKASQRPDGTVRVLLSNRDPGDEFNKDASEADTRVRSWSKFASTQTNPQFVQMVKRETQAELAALNAQAADQETDVSQQFFV